MTEKYWNPYDQMKGVPAFNKGFEEVEEKEETQQSPSEILKDALIVDIFVSGEKLPDEVKADMIKNHNWGI